MANTSVKQHVPIFVSSTYEDLAAYREEVQRVIVRLEQVVKGMEFFGANPESPLSKCLQTVRESKVYIGIIGMRYGSLEKDSGKSFTELEYNEAVKNKIPVLIYMLDDNYPFPPKFVDKGDRAKMLDEFKARLKMTHVVSTFTTPSDLGKKITEDLTETLKKDYEINSTASNSLLKQTKEEYCKIIKGFSRRPYKYYGQEIIVDALLTPSQTGPVKPSLCKSFGLQIGDVSYVNASIELADGESVNTILIGDGEMADWIDDIERPRRATLKVRLAYCVLSEEKSYDGGVILKEYNYLRLILLDVIKEGDE